MTGLHCAVVGCQDEAVTVFRGLALCERCVQVSDEIPDHVPAELIERIIANVIGGEYTLFTSLLKRGYVYSQDRPYERAAIVWQKQDADGSQDDQT